MRNHIQLVCIVALLSGVACNQGSSQSSGNESKEKKANILPSKETNAEPEESDNDAFYTGFDGDTDFSILVPRFRNVTIKDPSIAKIDEIPVKLPEETIDVVIAAAKSTNPDLREDRVRKMLGRETTTYRITPLKAGKTTLITSGGRGGQAGRKQAGWSKSKSIDLIVNAYTADQVAAGKLRYETDGGGGNLRDCKSCHESGKEGAPPHELGRIMEISDKQALTWIKTGKLDGREAKIPHTWEFSSDEEEEGIVAYLRSKQTHDVETLTKLVVQEMLANGFGPGGPGNLPPPPDVGTSPASGASTATMTSTSTISITSTGTGTATVQ